METPANITITKSKIENLSCGCLDENAEGIFHKKILSCLSVVQATKGSYDIKINNSEKFNTGEGGVFIAPAGAVQEITHHDGKDGKMTAHWVFINAVINDVYRPEDVFSFPVVLEKKYNETVNNLITKINTEKNHFKKISFAYDLLALITEVSKPNVPDNPIKIKITEYVIRNYRDDITAKNIAEHIFCSVPQVFRYIGKFFGLSPANYINRIRLSDAETQVRNTDKPFGEIAYSVGFSDYSYFSKLFTKIYGSSPRKYRNNVKIT